MEEKLNVGGEEKKCHYFPLFYDFNFLFWGLLFLFLTMVVDVWWRRMSTWGQERGKKWVGWRAVGRGRTSKEVGVGVEEGRFITMSPPPSNEQIQKIQKLQDDLSPPSAPLSTPHLLPPSHKRIEVAVREREKRG